MASPTVDDAGTVLLIPVKSLGPVRYRLKGGNVKAWPLPLQADCPLDVQVQHLGQQTRRLWST